MRNIIKKDFLKQMKITKIREVKTPTRGTECSAGLDFYVPAGIRLCMLPGDDVLIPSGIKVEVPHGYALIAHNRSSMATSTRAMKYAGLKGNPNSTRGCVVVGACVVDEDYQGEIYIHLINVGRCAETIIAGMKVVQLVLTPVSYEGVEVVDEEELFNQASERGKGGFGSTNNGLI